MRRMAPMPNEYGTYKKVKARSWPTSVPYIQSVSRSQELTELHEAYAAAADLPVAPVDGMAALVMEKVRSPPRKVDVMLPGKWNSNSHGARPVHLIITMIKWTRPVEARRISRWRPSTAWSPWSWRRFSPHTDYRGTSLIRNSTPPLGPP